MAHKNYPPPPPDPDFDTIPLHPQQPQIEYFQPIQLPPQAYRPAGRQRRPRGCCSCVLIALLPFAALLVFALAYLLAPLRTNLLLLGIDRAPDGSLTGRSDTIILVSVVPLRPDITMLSIPRDLWVNIPGVGENRINTAHFFAEANRAGSGPEAALVTVEANFGVSVPYYARVRFDTIVRVVDAMGGVTISLPEPAAGLPAGAHRLNGAQALAFTRDRSGTDDFFRMEHGQLMLRAVARQLLQPASWPYLPSVAQVAFESIDTNLPIWHWPRLGVALLRAGPDGIDSRTIRREMVTPYVTDGGAQVLLPEWERINPMIEELFGE